MSDGKNVGQQGGRSAADSLLRYGLHRPPAGSPIPVDTTRPLPADALELPASNAIEELELDPLALRYPDEQPDVMTPLRLRFQGRQLIREFLSSVPRTESETTLTFLRQDGTTRVLTRAQLSAAIDLLRPRQRQIVRLTAEERWNHKQVCAYLNNISLRTVERDLAEALDILAQL